VGVGVHVCVEGPRGGTRGPGERDQIPCASSQSSPPLSPACLPPSTHACLAALCGARDLPVLYSLPILTSPFPCMLTSLHVCLPCSPMRCTRPSSSLFPPNPHLPFPLHAYLPPRMPALQPYAVHATFQFSGTPGKRNRMREHMFFEDKPGYYDHKKGFVTFTVRGGEGRRVCV
jgi:hypothetical protein